MPFNMGSLNKIGIVVLVFALGTVHAQSPDSLFRRSMVLGGQEQIGGMRKTPSGISGRRSNWRSVIRCMRRCVKLVLRSGKSFTIAATTIRPSLISRRPRNWRMRMGWRLRRPMRCIISGNTRRRRVISKTPHVTMTVRLAICRNGNDDHLLVLILTSRGKNYISEGRLSLALQYYLEAFQLSEQLHDELLYAQTCSHLGSFYSMLDQYDKALEYNQKAFSRRDDLNNPEGIAKSCNNIGILFRKLKQTDSALAYFNQALDLCEKTHYKKGLVKALTNIGIVYSERTRTRRPFRCLDTAFLISTQAGFGYGIASSSLYLANLYQKQGPIVEGAVLLYVKPFQAFQHRL
jgi:Tfp pilus assembly protein PilF